MGGTSKHIATKPMITENRIIPGFKTPIRIQIVSPSSPQIRPLLVFYHGGGWVGGSLWAVENFCRSVADLADCVVISVEYHLAPEHPYPEGLEDAYLAIKWAVAHMDDLGFNPEQISIGGDSAGGNFAAVIALLAKERKEFSIARQILIYPATDLTGELDTGTEQTPLPKAMKKLTNIMTLLYFKGKVNKSDLKISPALGKDLSNLPPALITVGDQDFLYKSAINYGKKLSDAGNTVRCIVYKGANHAYIDDTGNSEQANDFVKEAVAFIRGT